MSHIDSRHPSVEQILQFFEFEHLPQPIYSIGAMCADLALHMADTLPEEGPELTAGLRKLLEAKDCFVRAEVSLGRIDKDTGERIPPTFPPPTPHLPTT